jgi:hypothetical protein
MNVWRHTTATIALAVLGLATVSGQQGTDPSRQTQALNLSAYAELLRSDVRTLKVAILTEVMGFSEAEDDAFWPIYREYDVEMSKLGDQRLDLVAEYAKHYSTLTDSVADDLARRALELEVKRQALRQRCYERVKVALSPRTAMRFLQVEHQLQLVIDLQVAASLPIAPPVAPAKPATSPKGTTGRK